MKMRFLFAVLSLGALVSACDSSPGGAEAPVGSWIRMRTSLEVRDRYTFKADGSFTFDENKPNEPQNEDHLVGTYVANDGIVTATVTNTPLATQARLTFSYYANDKLFTSAALLPRGGHAGIVGVWTGIRKLELLNGSAQGAQGATAEYDFRADGTFHRTLTPFDGGAASTLDGTWLEEAASTVRLTPTPDPAHPDVTPVDQIFHVLDGAALYTGDEIWERK